MSPAPPRLPGGPSTTVRASLPWLGGWVSGGRCLLPAWPAHVWTFGMGEQVDGAVTQALRGAAEALAKHLRVTRSLVSPYAAFLHFLVFKYSESARKRSY